MGRIYMRVFIRNESDATLVLTGSELEHGDWTGGAWMPPGQIGPGEEKGFQSEGSIVAGQATTGTEGRVRYTIQSADKGGGELYVHFNSPLIESQYGNTFHVFAPPDWEVAHWGGQGGSGELKIRLRRTERQSVPGFSPRSRGFAFSNSWRDDLPVITVGYLWNRLWESMPGPLGQLGIEKVADENWLPLTHADAGLCGGMVFSVMDYYNNRLLPPAQDTAPTSVDDPLFDYIRDRLWDSFDVGGGGHRWLAYSSPHYPNGDEGVIQVAGLAFGRSWVSYREQWPRIQDDIDAGRLSPVGLIHTDSLDLGTNHQVLAYAYERSGQHVRLFVYDPNHPRQEVTLNFDVTATDGEVHVRRFVDGTAQDSKRIWCFFRIDGYGPHHPPGGRRITSLREAVMASGQRKPPLSLRRALPAAAGGSVRTWLPSG